MNPATLRYYLDHAEAAAEWLRRLGIVDVDRAHGNLLEIATSGMTLDLVAVICDQFGPSAERIARSRPVLTNLDRFVAAVAQSAGPWARCFERDPTALPTLLHIFSTSQHFSDLLVQRPGGFRPAADDRGAAGGEAIFGRGHRGRGGGPGPRPGGAARPCGGSSAARRCGSPTATSSASRACSTVTRADFLPGRRDPRGGPAGGLAQAAPAARHAAIGRRPAGPVRRPGHGQARRLRAELLQRHRPDFPLRCRREDRRQAADHQRRVLRPARPRTASAC